jgi:hypothetical protein
MDGNRMQIDGSYIQKTIYFLKKTVGRENIQQMKYKTEFIWSPLFYICKCVAVKNLQKNVSWQNNNLSNGKFYAL